MPEIRHYTCDDCHNEWRFKFIEGRKYPIVVTSGLRREEVRPYDDCPACASDNIACYRTDPYAAKAKPKGRS